MEARRIDHKTYIDAKWLLDQYDTFKDKEKEEAVLEAIKGLYNFLYDHRTADTETDLFVRFNKEAFLAQLKYFSPEDDKLI